VAAAAIVVGVLVGGHLGPFQRPTAATSLPATATSALTSTATGLDTSAIDTGTANEATPTPTPAGTPTPATTPSPSPETPTPSPIATPPAFGIVFTQGYRAENCGYSTSYVYPFTCETVSLAEFYDPSSTATYDTAQVSFADASVTLPGGANDVFIVHIQPLGWNDVSAGHITFLAPGTYPYTVTITNTVDGAAASWTGSIPVGPQPSPTASASTTPS
jgi:hypothetical protein